MLEKKELLQKNLSLLLSYLEVIPSDQNHTNKIYSIANKNIEYEHKKCGKVKVSKRNQENGYSQIKLKVGVKCPSSKYKIETYNIRIENNVWLDKVKDTCSLSLNTTKVEALQNCNILCFGDENDHFYISLNDHKWLMNSKYVTQKKVTSCYGSFCVNEYDIYKLLADKKIIGLAKRPETNDVVSYTGLAYDNTQIIQSYTYDDYEKELKSLEGLYLQADPRFAAVIYYCYLGQRFTSKYSTIPELAAKIATLTGENQKSIAGQLYRSKRETTKDNRAHYTTFDIKKDKLAYIQNDIDLCDALQDGKLAICISLEKDFDVFENAKMKKTEDMKEYQKKYGEEHKETMKEYQKKYQEKNADMLKMHKRVATYLKRNNGKFNPKWNAEEKEYAKSII